MGKDQYKCFQGVIKLWCFLKWKNSEVNCAEQPTIESADVTTIIDAMRVGFVLTLDKTTEFLKQQILNCRKSCDKVYLITNEIDLENIPEVEAELGILNIADRFCLGNVVEEL